MTSESYKFTSLIKQASSKSLVCIIAWFVKSWMIKILWWNGLLLISLLKSMFASDCLHSNIIFSVTGSLMKWNLTKINYFTVCFRQTLKNSANVNKKVSEMQCWLLCVFLFCYNSTGLKHRSGQALCSEAKLSDNRTYGYSHNLCNLYFSIFPWQMNNPSFSHDLTCDLCFRPTGYN